MPQGHSAGSGRSPDRPGWGQRQVTVVSRAISADAPSVFSNTRLARWPGVTEPTETLEYLSAVPALSLTDTSA